MSFFSTSFRQDAKQNQLETHLKDLGEWTDALLQQYLGALIQEHIKIFGNIDDTSDTSLEDSEKYLTDYRRLFAQKLGVPEADPGQIPAFLENMRQTKVQILSMSHFRDALQEQFTVENGIPRKNGNKHEQTNVQSTLGEELPTQIIAALQEVILAVPTEFYGENANVLPRIERLLTAALRRIEIHLRHRMELKDEKLQLNKRQVELLQKLTLADRYIRIPLEPLVTAPLGEQDIDRLYAREDNEPEARLARQILRSTGVILITGYRGVGKSTFINKVLRDLKNTYVPLQTIQPRWHVVPVQISLAKTNNVATVLRHCIRSLHTLFQSDEALSALLLPDEHTLLQVAYIRAAFRYSQEQSESAANAIETNAVLKASLGDFINSKLPVPSFEGSISRVWGTKFAKSIALLDYDEDEAERDINVFIEKLARERSPSWIKEQNTPVSKLRQRLEQAAHHDKLPSVQRQDNIRIKLVFVFDEMDKMDEKTGQMPLVNQLKNLFLNRYAVFLLLTSKQFYYRWLAERQQEDTVLNSYFSSVTLVPMFGTEDTLRLLQNFSKAPVSNDNDAVLTFARYLNYRAMGIPREILRELHEMQQWLPDSLQPYLTDRSSQFGIALLYSKIQMVLEALDKESSQIANQSQAIGAEGSSEEPSSDSNQQEDSSAEIVLAPERFWRNDGLREQIRRGRYILVEQMLTDSFLEWDEALLQDEKSKLYQIHKNNFGLVSTRDFLKLLKDLVTGLETIELEKEKYTVLATGNELPSRIKLFHRNSASQGNEQLVVDNIFYPITGRSPNLQAPSAIDKGEALNKDLSDEAVREYLKSGSYTKVKQVLAYLANQPTIQGEQDIQKSLYEIFMSKETGLPLRTSAGRFLVGTRFLHHLNQSNIEQTLQQEHDPEILEQIISLVRAGVEGARVSKANTQISRRALLALFSRGLNLQGDNFPSGKLSNTLFISAGNALVAIGADQDSLTAVVSAIEAGSKLDERIISLLQTLHQESKESLLQLLVTKNIHGISKSKIRELVSEEKDIIGLWIKLLPQKNSSLAQQVLTEILFQLTHAPSSGNKNQVFDPTPILEWLNSTYWLSADRNIFDQAAAYPQVLSYLETLSNQSETYAEAKSRVQGKVEKEQAQESSQNQEQKEKPPTPLSPEAKRKKRRNQLLATMGLFALYAVFILLPTDLPIDVTTRSRLIGRLLEFVYLPVSVLGVYWLISGIFIDREVGKSILGVVTLILVGLCFYILLVVMQHPLTLGGQAILHVINVVGLFGMLLLLGSAFEA